MMISDLQSNNKILKIPCSPLLFRYLHIFQPPVIVRGFIFIKPFAWVIKRGNNHYPYAIHNP